MLIKDRQMTIFIEACIVLVADQCLENWSMGAEVEPL